MSQTPLLHTLSVALGTDTTPDAELLRRFAETGDRTAFELVVRRHAELVWRVCRLALPRDRHAAEDAFQATFLALARRAGSVRDASAAGWLFRVARNASVRARRAGRAPEPLPDALVAPGTTADDGAACGEVARVVVEEVDRLTAKLRTPIVLCFFEGHTHAEAAARLGWPVGTVASRLARAKDVLRAQLTRRGVALPATGLAAVFIATDAGAAPVRSALALAGRPGRVPPNVLTLTEGVLSAMRFTQLKTVATVVVLAVGLTALAAVPRDRAAPDRAERVPGVRGSAPPAPPSETPEAKKPDPKELEEKELKALKGEWRVVRSWKGAIGLDGGTRVTEADADELAALRVVFADDELRFRSSKENDEEHYTIAVSPAEKPCHIDITSQKGGKIKPGQIGHGIYERNGDALKMCFPDVLSAEKPRPTELNAGEGRVFLVLERVKDAQEELKALKGQWKGVKMTVAGKDEPADEVAKMRWVFDAADVVLTGEGQGEDKAVIKIDPTAVPPTIDLTLKSGPPPEKGTVLAGVYFRQENKLTICLVDPKKKGAVRPTELKPGDGRLFLVLERLKDARDELKALAGDWKAVKFNLFGKDIEGANAVKNWHIDGASAILGGGELKEVKAALKIDPAAVPPTITLTINDGEQKGTELVGIYDLQGDKLTVCFTLVRGGVRPTEFKPGEDRMFAVYERKPKK